MTNEELVEPLTPREAEILEAVVQGASNAEIARRLVLSAETVKWYIKQLYGKLGVHTREEAIARALALGLAANQADVRAQYANEAGCRFINPLPQDVADRYVGQAEKLTRFRQWIDQGARLIAVYGRAGAGKTALACKGLGDLRFAGPRSNRPIGVVSLDAAVTGITLLRLFADVGRLLPDPDRILIDAIARNSELAPGSKTAILLEKVAGQRIIVLLDNLETIQRPGSSDLIEPGLQQFLEMSLAQSSALSFVITSREPLVLPGPLKTWEHVISLEDGLPANEAVALLRRFDPSGAAGLRDAPGTDLNALAERLGGFPRALESVAGMLLEDPILTLGDVTQRVGALEGEITVAVVQQALAHLNDDAVVVLAALAVFGQPATYEALAYLTTDLMGEATLRAVLGRLIRACFVKANRLTRQYALHPIDQNYCYERIPAGNAAMPGNAEPFTRAALHLRAAEYYRAQALPKESWRRLSDLEPQINEFRHLTAAGDIDAAVWLLLEIDRDHLWEWGYQKLLQELYAALPTLLGDPHLAHQVRRRRAWLMFFTAPDESDREFANLLDSARTLGWPKEEADALDDLAQTYRRGSRDLEQAAEYHRQALALYRQICDRRGEADALGGLGAIYTEIEPEEAIEYLVAASAIQRDLGNANSLSFVLSMLGASYFYLGLNGEAMAAAQEAARVARESSSLEALGRAYSELAVLHVEAGDIEAGQVIMDQAKAAVLASRGVPITGSLPIWVCQVALRMTLARHPDAGIALMEQTVADADAALPQVAPFARYLLSLVLAVAGDYRRARSLMPAVPDNERLVVPLNSTWLGVLLIKTGERAAARSLLEHALGLLPEHDSAASTGPSISRGHAPMVALGWAAMAVIDQDSRLAAKAVEAARLARGSRVWQSALLPVLVDALCQEPDGAVLASVREVLAGA